MTLRFDTSTVERPERMAYWRDSICEHHVSVEVEVLEASKFGGFLDISGMGHLQICNALSKAAAYHHRPSHIREDASDDFLLNHIVKGSATLEQGGKTIIQKPGDLVIYDVSRPYTLSCPETMHSYVARIPRALLLSRNPSLESMPVHAIKGTTLAGRLVGSMIRECHGYQREGDEQSIPKLSATLLDVIATAIESSVGYASTTPGQANMLDRVKRHILANLEDPDLSIDSISSELGVSPRTLNRVFASEGTTLMRWLWRQRLFASYRALAEGKIRQVTMAAFSFGFSDVSHFSRSFKKEFGVPPNAFLQSTANEAA